ncbi:hypothetical protein U8527_11680 [Kordia algicida OT-1]|uniref:Uncharacterized protein n=1 Tax=Kordia algicida OT-1 TaxID=391587 RepID=A9DZX4_9FLAO|nr:hypothetical protein [Kordia algicida]EDP95773.1 hypothetical protein KAOT1_05197 [Kordia algicida OT-1]
MNKTIYNFLVLLFISSFGLIAQTQKKYQKSFSVDEKTKLSFDTQNIDVTFKTWDKDEVKIDFVVNFKNYSQDEIEEIYKGIKISTDMQSNMNGENFLYIRNASATSIGHLSYRLRGNSHLVIKDIGGKSEKENQYKTVAAINNEISQKNLAIQEMSGHIVSGKDKIPLKDIDKTTHKNVQTIRSSYEVYVPKYMMFRFSSTNANVYFKSTFTNQIEAAFNEGTLEAFELINDKNNFTFMNGSVKIKKIVGGQYAFRNVTNGLIGQLENVFLLTEFSKFSIGEITKNTEFKDFKSNFLIHNLADNFKSIQMNCEYSDIKMYIDKSQQYYMEAVGNNAVLNDDGTKIIMQPNKDGQKFKMFTRGKNNPETRKNMFKLDLIHGFVTLLYNK